MRQAGTKAVERSRASCRRPLQWRRQRRGAVERLPLTCAPRRALASLLGADATVAARLTRCAVLTASLRLRHLRLRQEGLSPACRPVRPWRVIQRKCRRAEKRNDQSQTAHSLPQGGRTRLVSYHRKRRGEQVRFDWRWILAPAARRQVTLRFCAVVVLLGLPAIAQAQDAVCETRSRSRR